MPLHTHIAVLLLVSIGSCIALTYNALTVASYGAHPEPPILTATSNANPIPVTHAQPIENTRAENLASRTSIASTAPAHPASEQNLPPNPVAPPSQHTNDDTGVRRVPFYSQFKDISDPAWQKVGCGIASISMILDYYTDATVTVETLLTTGRARGAYETTAGWSHAGLIALLAPYGLAGESRSLSTMSLDAAFDTLRTVLTHDPVMASVHYTFEPKNPIPHLVVITDITDDAVYYNDPADQEGGKHLSHEQFKRAWKQRYITFWKV